MADLIDRQIAIKAADAIIQRDTSGKNDVVQAMKAWKAFIEALPSAHQWIPCSKCERKCEKWENLKTSQE